LCLAALGYGRLLLLVVVKEVWSIII